MKAKMKAVKLKTKGINVIDISTSSSVNDSIMNLWTFSLFTMFLIFGVGYSLAFS